MMADGIWHAWEMRLSKSNRINESASNFQTFHLFLLGQDGGRTFMLLATYLIGDIIITLNLLWKVCQERGVSFSKIFDLVNVSPIPRKQQEKKESAISEKENTAFLKIINY